MQKITCHFDKAQYLPGEPVRLILPENSASPSVSFFRMEREISLHTVRQGDALVLTDVPPGGYGVRVSAPDGVWEGAFDVVSDRRTEIATDAGEISITSASSFCTLALTGSFTASTSE